MISGESWSGMAEKLVLFNWNRDSNLSLLHHDNSFISLIKGRAPPQGCLLNPCTHFCLSRRDAFAHPARSFGPRRSFLWPGHRSSIISNPDPFLVTKIILACAKSPESQLSYAYFSFSVGLQSQKFYS